MNSVRLIDNVAYHVWTDALHARELARKAKDPWNRGTYVRWAVASAWLAFEAACEDALSTSGLGTRFKERVNEAVTLLKLPALDWSQGLWSNVLKMFGWRKDYVHPRIPRNRLWALVAEAEEAIQVLRAATKAIYLHAGKAEPKWVEVDEDWGDPRGGVPDVLHLDPGVEDSTPGALIITFVFRGEERPVRIMRPGSGWESEVKKMIANPGVPIKRIAVYRVPQAEPIFSQDLLMRGSY